MTKENIASEALQNALSGQSLINYENIINGFVEKGLNAEDITPRKNVFTYNAWRALGRYVRRGERGVKIVTWIKYDKVDKKSGEVTAHRMPHTTTVFHISQTAEISSTAEA